MYTADNVFPTLVGVFPVAAVSFPALWRLPHARGGVSSHFPVGFIPCWSSPRSWGCFLVCQAQLLRVAVFPTLVGVFPVLCPAATSEARLPHARGGVS